ncbi:MAG: hypothetical protein BZY88_15640 [SAR202 cluster bacterium Io17-Chloro-G9]|nr:MAG: hypothetical protein BZY88_15640 [SAR202 cluster bacterium Io17-Chloro-G9]
MAEDNSVSPTGVQSRRNFLVKLGLGAAAMAMVSVPFFFRGRGKPDRSPSASQDSPGEDSIFHPRSGSN